MISVIILGSGNVAQHLTRVCLETDNIDLVQVYARNLEKLSFLNSEVNITNNIKSLEKADVYIIAVSDNAINEVAEQLPKNYFVVHTSGVTSINELGDRPRKGVFYMLQSFSANKKVDFNKIPFLLEASDKKELLILEKLASSIGKKSYRIDSEQRQYLHVGAVFVNNFTNHMYKLGHDICQKHNMSFDILKPLILETATKINELNPKDAQTGPARRNDTKTIEKHLNLLAEDKKELYNIISKSIQNEYKL